MGYSHELIEVNDCLRAGRTESEVMPLSDTLAVAARAQRRRRAARLSTTRRTSALPSDGTAASSRELTRHPGAHGGAARGRDGAVRRWPPWWCFQLVRLGFWAAGRVTVHAGATAPVGLPSGTSLHRPRAAAVADQPRAGAAGRGAARGLVGLVITQTWDRQGPLRAAPTGALLTFVVALVVKRDGPRAGTWTSPLTYERWSHLVGYPSALFVVVFAGVGGWLYVSRAREASAPMTFDLRERVLSRAVSSPRRSAGPRTAGRG